MAPNSAAPESKPISIEPDLTMPPCSRLEVGGQAVIEGVMMRSKRSFAVVCRRQSGEIVIKEDAWMPIWGRFKALRWPILRGGVTLLESMMNGISALTFSAEQQAQGDPKEEGSSKETSGGEKSESKAPAKPPEELSKIGLFMMMAVSIGFGFALFVGAPHLLTWLLGFDSSTFAFHIVDGTIKLAILIAYMGLIGLQPEVRRVFQYHGAEHKAIATYEQGLPLTVEHARAQTRFHPRCGTSFLLIVVAVSIVLFAVLLRFDVSDNKLIDNLAKIAIKIPLMFPVAGLAYEAIRLSARFSQKSLFVRGMTAPGLLLQHLTTREPSDDQLEIALVSIRKTLWRERILGVQAAAAQTAAANDTTAGKIAAPAPAPMAARAIEVFRSFAEVDLPLA